MPITASKYINNSDSKNSYIGLFNYKRAMRGKELHDLDMYGLLAVSSDTTIPGDKLLKFAWDGVIDGFEYSKTDSTNESLKLSLTEATRRVKQLIVNDKEIEGHDIDINFTIFVSNNGGIYIGLLGESDIFVYKKGRLVDIFEMLKSKNAKTAAVAIEEGDLVFSSTKDFLRVNMPKLISAKDRGEIVTVLEEIGQDIGNDMGLVVLSKYLENEAKEFQTQSEEINEMPALQKVEPQNSDYVPEFKIKEKIFKSTQSDRDLKSILNGVSVKLSFLRVFPNKVFPKLKSYTNSVGGKLGSIIRNSFNTIKGKISEKLGRKRWFKRVSAKVSQSGVVKRKSPEFKEFRIDGYKQKETRFHRIKILFLILLGIGLLVGGVKFTLDQKEAREKSKAANEIFSEIESLINDAKSKIGTDRESSELYIFRASEAIAKLPEDLGTNDSEKLEDLKGQVLGIEDTLYRKVRLSISQGNIEKYFDTFNSNQESKPEDLGIFRDENGNEYLVVADSGSKSVYTISLYDKKINNVKDESKLLSNPFKVYTRSSGIFVYDLNNGILKSNFASGSFNNFTKLSGLGVSSISAGDVAEFAILTTNENAYILDREGKTVLKSINFEGGYGLSSPYLSKEEYSEGNDIFSDDLSVYVLAQQENGIYRYVGTSKGMVESPITLTGMDSPVGNPSVGFTVDNLNNGFFVFDSNERRLLKFEKPIESGEKRHPNELLLLNQYVFDNEKAWKDVKDIVVDYKEKNIYILDGTTIWKVKM